MIFIKIFLITKTTGWSS